ncbi:hypothetical protein ABZP36_011501 [Zizania latifolia]
MEAIKIIRGIKYRDAAMTEIGMLEQLGKYDRSRSSCVQIQNWFDYRNHICIVCEKLGPSLYDFLRKNNYRSFPIALVREVAKQLLEFMHELRLIHTDLKPENILLVSPEYIKVPDYKIMNATDRLLLETRDVAQKLNTGIHMHIAEIPYENQLVMRTKEIDHGTVTYLEKIDFLRSNLLAAHSVWLNKPEIELFLKADVKVSHCPASAMRMLGFAPIREMLDSGVCVSLGTDGAPSNNRMSIVDEMYLASLINKGREVYISGTTNPTALPAETVLKMATINGAKAVLWDKEIGSLEVGKKADMVVVNPFTWSMVPVHDCIANLVYCMRTENIESVMCNGRWIMREKKIVNLNEEEVISSAGKRASNLLARAAIKLPERMNCL